FRSPSWLTPDASKCALSASSAPRLLTGAPCGGLKPSSAGRLRRAHLHLWHNTAQTARSSTSTPPRVRGAPSSAYLAQLPNEVHRGPSSTGRDFGVSLRLTPRVHCHGLTECS